MVQLPGEGEALGRRAASAHTSAEGDLRAAAPFRDQPVDTLPGPGGIGAEAVELDAGESGVGERPAGSGAIGGLEHVQGLFLAVGEETQAGGGQGGVEAGGGQGGGVDAVEALLGDRDLHRRSGGEMALYLELGGGRLGRGPRPDAAYPSAEAAALPRRELVDRFRWGARRTSDLFGRRSRLRHSRAVPQALPVEPYFHEPVGWIGEAGLVGRFGVPPGVGLPHLEPGVETEREGRACDRRRSEALHLAAPLAVDVKTQIAHFEARAPFEAHAARDRVGEGLERGELDRRIVPHHAFVVHHTVEHLGHHRARIVGIRGGVEGDGVGGDAFQGDRRRLTGPERAVVVLRLGRHAGDARHHQEGVVVVEHQPVVGQGEAGVVVEEAAGVSGIERVLHDRSERRRQSVLLPDLELVVPAEAVHGDQLRIEHLEVPVHRSRAREVGGVVEGAAALRLRRAGEGENAVLYTVEIEVEEHLGQGPRKGIELGPGSAAVDPMGDERIRRLELATGLGWIGWLGQGGRGSRDAGQDEPEQEEGQRAEPCAVAGEREASLSAIHEAPFPCRNTFREYARGIDSSESVAK